MHLIKTKKYLKSCFVFLLIICMTLSFTIISHAEDVTMIGTVVLSSGTLNVRSTASTSAQIIGSLSNGAQVSIYSTETGSNKSWYKIAYNGSYGYVCADFVTITRYITPEDYNTYLSNQGFPESYWPALKQLHSQYPNWVFTAKQTNLDWSTVISNESVLRRNLVQNSFSDSWKSYENGAYDWSTNSFVGLDGSSWVAASSDLISYYIDPRNFLDSTYVFQYKSFAYSSSETTTGINNILSGTFMDSSHAYSDSQFATFADAILSAASETNVSAYMLASRIKQEQGNSGNSLAFGTTPGYEGYYNQFDIAAAAGSGNSATTNGAIYAKAKGWDTAYKAIVGGASVIASSYIYKGQNTLYFQKFNVVNVDSGLYSHQYMTNVMAPCSEGSNLLKAYSTNQLNSEAIAFNIPVYNNMPASAVAKPTASGNNNNLLSDLSVPGYTLNQSFDRYTYSYGAVVSSTASNVNINATASDGGAAVSGAGNVGLNYGNNSINIVVTATNGSTRTYSLNVFRQLPKITGVTLNKSESTINDIGSTEQLTATVSSDGATTTDLIWTSSDQSVATVDSTGKVTAVGYGRAAITVTTAIDSKTANCIMNVGVCVSYRTHVQDFGWQNNVYDGNISGTQGQSKRLEAININVENDSNLGISYSTHVQDVGWQGFVSDGAMSGTEGQSKRLEAIKIKLTGSDAELYDVYYCVHAQALGWLDWAKNGEAAGTEGLSLRLEAIKIVIVKKTDNVQFNTAFPFVSVFGDGNINYRTHVQDYGWQNYVGDGWISGTQGESLRLEGINIRLSTNMPNGSVIYSTHVQDIGWMNEVSDGALSGTQGQSKRLEAIKINLTGDVAAQYDVYYRVHAQDVGWMGWAKNGESAGTEGFSRRLEGIQIVLVKKGDAAPSSTDSAFIKK